MTHTIEESEKLRISGSQHPVVRTERLLSINKSQMKSDSRIYTVIKTHEPRRLNEPKQNKWVQRFPTHVYFQGTHMYVDKHTGTGIYRQLQSINTQREKIFKYVP